MKCLRCAYSFGDLRPNYCPNCGKKVPADLEADDKSLKNVEVWCYIPFDMFKKEWEEIKGLDAEDAFVWLTERHEPIPVYTIETVRKWREHKPKTFCKISTDDLYDYLIRDPGYITAAYPRKTSLKRVYTPDTFEKSWWWTKEDCIAAIQKTQDRASHTIILNTD